VKKKNSKGYYKRPCLLLHVHGQLATVSLITRFHHNDPTSIDPSGKIMLPELSRQFLFKYFLAVSPNIGVPGRRSVHSLY
jgi:hypothetical protein